MNTKKNLFIREWAVILLLLSLMVSMAVIAQYKRSQIKEILRDSPGKKVHL